MAMPREGQRAKLGRAAMRVQCRLHAVARGGKRPVATNGKSLELVPVPVQHRGDR
jgi:hypothetical protein